MSESTIWWLLAGGAVAIELATTTLYLLMVAIGFVAAAVAAHLGAALWVQMLVGAIAGTAALLVLMAWRKKHAVAMPASANRDVNLDIGETVMVDAWNADGTANVRYRGANWTAVSTTPSGLLPGQHRVTQVIGNRLVLANSEINT